MKSIAPLQPITYYTGLVKHRLKINSAAQVTYLVCRLQKACLSYLRRGARLFSVVLSELTRMRNKNLHEVKVFHEKY